jgi:hypothetical protein
MSNKGMLTRREACIVLGALGAGALGLAGCNTSSSDPANRQGFANDTEVKSYSVHLKLYADSYARWHMHGIHKDSDGQPLTELDDKIERYRTQKDRSEVSFEVVYVDTAELLTMALDGFPDGDGMLALHPTMLKGCESGTVDAGVGLLSVRDQSYHFNDNSCLVRATGGDADLPPAATLTGESSPDGQINRLQQLPNFDGVVALADPATTLEGRLANQALAVEDFYREGSPSECGGLIGGSFSEDIADKIAIYPSQDAAMAAVIDGECQLGFALQTSLKMRYPEVEEVYRPQSSRVWYDGAALMCSDEPGVMRDFFEFILQCTD